MSWMGGAAGNLALGGLMYGGLGVMTYDSQTSDPLNQTLKIGGAFAIDTVIDTSILAGGGIISRGYKSMVGDDYDPAGGMRYAKSHMKKGGSHIRDAFAGDVSKKSRLFSGVKSAGRFGMGAMRGATSVGSQAMNFGLKRAGGVGLAAHMALGFMGVDPASLFMNAWDQSEQEYRKNIRRKPNQLTHASSRYIQDQLHSMRGAGNEAEFMHN